MDIKNLDEVPSFITKDGSEIRELLAHRNSVIRNQSLAEARVAGRRQHAGTLSRQNRGNLLHHARHGTDPHRRRNARREAGDAIAIPPGSKHKLWNTGNETLRLLCCCAPAYEHDDTVITESPALIKMVGARLTGEP